MTQIPKEKIKEILEQLEIGFRVFLHTETLELVTYPNEDRSAFFDPSIWKNEIQAVSKGNDKYFELQGMSSHDSFRVMEDFLDTVNDSALKDKLSRALNQKRPFAHFKVEIGESGMYRDKWFKYRDQKLTELVIEQLGQIP